VIETAILLAAGLGTRLAPLSLVRAKAALPVAGEALIRRQIRWLAAAGVRHVVVNLHHLPASITGLVGHGDDLGVDVRYSWEPRVLGSGGGPRRAFDLVAAERAIIVNGDTLTDLDLAALVAAHERHQPLVTMASTLAARHGYNALAVDPRGCLTGVTRAGHAPAAERAHDRHVHFIGVQVAERRAFADASPDAPSEVLKQLYPALLRRDAAAVRVMPADVTFHDIGTPADYVATVRSIAAAEGRPLDHGRDCRVEATAEVTGSVLWDRVTIGAGAVVRDSVLADDVVVPAGARLSGVAVTRRADIADGVPGHAEGDLWIAPLGAAA
jgi:NDP-sugar pyrophosphorylase family protein